MKRRVLAVALFASALTSEARAQVPVTSEIRVNVGTHPWHMEPAVASDAHGHFVVVWSDEVVTYRNGVLARRFQPSGLATDAAEFRVNSYTTSAQWAPSVVSDATGRFVVTWMSGSYSGTQDGSRLGIYAQRFDSSATPEGGEFQVNTYTTGDQQAPRIALLDSGHFVAVWGSHNGSLASQDGDGAGVFAQRYDSAGVPQGNEFRVNTTTVGSQHPYGVVADPAGNFVVVWQGQDDDVQGVFGQRFDASAVPQGGEFQINTYTTGPQVMPAIAGDASGNFTVVWASLDPLFGVGDIFARRYDAHGVPQGPEFRVNSHTTRDQNMPAIAVDPGGAFLVAWVTHDWELARLGIIARMFDASGVPAGAEFRIGSTTETVSDPNIAALGGGNFVVTWTDGTAVYAQRFASDLIFRDGFENGTTSAWSTANADGGDLSVSGSAALKATAAGLQAVVDDTAGLYVQDDTPLDETRYRARFHLDPNGFDPGEAQGHLRTRVFIAFEADPSRRLFAVVLRRRAGAYALMARVRLDDGTERQTAFFPISDDPHSVELDWRRATAPGVRDGSLDLRIDGTLVETLSGLDNGQRGVDFARLGMLSVKAGAGGTPYLDEFESRRLSDIGP